MLVLWRVYEHCNLGCHFCGYSKQLHRSRTLADVDKVLAFGSILGEFARIQGRSVSVSWLGGEPLLWSELPELSRVFKREFGISMGVTSNGLPLESTAVRKSLIEGYSQLTVSVDGMGTFHDGCRDSLGLFDHIRRYVIALRGEADVANSPLKICVNTILMRGNVEDFERLCREVVTWGVSELTFNQLGGNDRPEFYPENRLLSEQVERFANELPRIRAEMAGLGLTIHGNDRYLNRIASTSRGLSIPIDDCDPGRSFLFIDERGRISPCSFTSTGYGVPIEEIAGPSDLARLPETFAERRQQRAAACEDCHSTQVFDKFSSPRIRLSLPTDDSPLHFFKSHAP
jgi:MoaA/NifB/PqqE/SkfB family radical SAM enzyme